MEKLLIINYNAKIYNNGHLAKLVIWSILYIIQYFFVSYFVKENLHFIYRTDFRFTYISCNTKHLLFAIRGYEKNLAKLQAELATEKQQRFTVFELR